ncbi:protein transporter Sec31 [Actinacidiphila sp. DG2A-62]|uniref:protein transporter Sec31 n=1 Tax=Actinacidiphila sp. DG2A-62 TaxID=3108821 RepID=UPI002DB745A9|nr:protein transporter Sec31 [Actinacidiphila sp. DG2A-62]MEC3994016.1 protein transporter Sec31 [Actinacidiphila sp. DG2A-62]
MPPAYRPITRNGRTHYVPIPAPHPPRDWDHDVLTAVTAATTLLVTVSVVWSTASIGDLLHRVTVPALAYGAATAFDLTWIIAMALEWRARYDETRARGPRTAGHVALAAAMAGVGIHGWLAGDWATAVVGATISALAKGSWTLVMRHQAVALDADTAAWLHAERAARGAARALAAEERVDARSAAQLQAIRTSLALPSPEESGPDPEESADSPDRPEPEPAVPPMTITDAVRTAVDSGITDPDAVLRYVRQRSDANASPETVGRYLRARRREAL